MNRAGVRLYEKRRTQLMAFKINLSPFKTSREEWETSTNALALAKRFDRFFPCESAPFFTHHFHRYIQNLRIF